MIAIECKYVDMQISDITHKQMVEILTTSIHQIFKSASDQMTPTRLGHAEHSCNFDV